MSRRTAAARASENRRRRRQTDEKPFIGCDGEGSGRDEQGRQNYMLFRCGDLELFTGKPLATVDCLELILSLPEMCIPVGFSFGYDVTMILRDLPAERMYRLLGYEEKDGKLVKVDRKPGASRYTYWHDYAIEYLPRNYFRVARTKRLPSRDGKSVRAVIPGSSRTIYETFGFFQKSFAKACRSFAIGVEHWKMVEAQKDLRGSDEWDATTPEVREYCRIECELLAQLMDALRSACLHADIRPRTWNGAGKLASALHAKHSTITRAHVIATVPAGVLAMGQLAYYGGRFEIARVGRLGEVWEHDIRSAYPDAMRRLPCLLHGCWEVLKPAAIMALPDDALWVAPLAFSHGKDTPLCGFPVRRDDGRVTWPRQGNGVYWSIEANTAKVLTGTYRVTRDGWIYRRTCDCQPFSWIEPLYDYRRSLGSSGKGEPIKYGINSLYGKLAQRIGAPKFANMIWASLITADCRSALIRAAATDPDSIVMLATDGIIAKRRLDVPEGDRLGQWEIKRRESLFVCQPGIYWSREGLKTRGVSAKFFAPYQDAFETVWDRFAEADRSCFLGTGAEPAPKVSVPVTLFIGSKLALARGKPETAGQWVTQDRTFSFAWHGKRSGREWESPTCIVTRPQPGSPGLQSRMYAPDDELLQGFDLSHTELDEQPDVIELRAFD